MCVEEQSVWSLRIEFSCFRLPSTDVVVEELFFFIKYVRCFAFCFRLNLSWRSGRSNFLRGWALSGPGQILFFLFFFFLFVIPFLLFSLLPFLLMSWVVAMYNTVTRNSRYSRHVFFFLNFHTISKISIKIAPPLSNIYHHRLCLICVCWSLINNESMIEHEKKYSTIQTNSERLDLYLCFFCFFAGKELW